ncbi:MAG: BatA domain-containing protein, partial [Bacteroidia bacterium]
MSFVYPTFLYALFSILIPILIHLFNFRKYKKVYFTNVKFLKELKQESQSKSRLKELLILASRILAITCLVLAFAQPVRVDKNAKVKTGRKAIGIYIDNSFSMEGVNRNGSLLNNAKKRAIEIVNAFGSSDKFQLLTNDFEGRHQRFLSREEITEAINEVKTSAAVKPLSLAVKRQADFLKSSGAPDLRQFIISDVQRSTFDVKNLTNDTLVASTFIPLFANNNNNMFIDSCWFDSPVQQKGMIQKLNVRVQNKSDKAIESGSLKLFINGKQAAIASFNAEADAKSETRISFECKEDGFNFCSLKIDDYPVTFDDELFFTFNSRLSIRAVLINGKQAKSAPFFKTLMQSDSMFSYTELSEQAIDFALFKNANIIFLNEVSNFPSGFVAELNKFVNSGGHLVIIPASGLQTAVYNPFLSALQLPSLSDADSIKLKLEKTDFKQGFYEGVFDKIDERMDLPVVLKHYPFNAGTRTAMVPVLKLQNGETWLGEAQ